MFAFAPISRSLAAAALCVAALALAPMPGQAEDAAGGARVIEIADPSKLPLLHRLAAEGGREAQRSLGMALLAHPKQPVYDFSAGRSWLEQSAAQGDCLSAHGLAAIQGWPSAEVPDRDLRNFHRLPNVESEYTAWLDRASRLSCYGARILSHPDLTAAQVASWPDNRIPRHMLAYAKTLYEAGIPGMNRLIAAEYLRAGHRHGAKEWTGILRPALAPDLMAIYSHAQRGEPDWQFQLGLILIRLERLAEHITGHPDRNFGFGGTARDWMNRAAEQGHPLALAWLKSNTAPRPVPQPDEKPLTQATPAKPADQPRPAAAKPGLRPAPLSPTKRGGTDFLRRLEAQESFLRQTGDATDSTPPSDTTSSPGLPRPAPASDTP